MKSLRDERTEMARGSSRSRVERRARLEKGHRAEDVAAEYLFADGYTILARNVRFGHRELDVVARKGAVVAIVEVRTRGPGSFAKPFASITREKRRHLLVASARLHERLARTHPTVERLRIDVLAVAFEPAGPRVEHATGAIVRGPGDRLF